MIKKENFLFDTMKNTFPSLAKIKINMLLFKTNIYFFFILVPVTTIPQSEIISPTLTGEKL